MSGPKTTKVGSCELVDYTPGSIVETAASYVGGKVQDAVGCPGGPQFDKGKNPSKDAACSMVRSAVHAVTEHPVFKSVVIYLAKWYMGEYALRKNGKVILGPGPSDKSPAAIFNAHSKCVKK